MEKSVLLRFRRSLLDWYRKNARDLPWRRTRDPYKIWVSEIMLQQTQVKTVIPYYEKWIARFPSIKALVKAPLSGVMKYWAGLGYYRRVRMLHKAAQYFSRKRRNADLPDSVEELLKIPGIGRYTAGAIASIAFNRKAPVLDGNVIRVLTRLTALKEDIGSGKIIKKLWALSESLLPEKNPGDFNQSLMELGATVCLPKNPDCKKCPVAGLCAAGRDGSALQYPFKKKKENLETLRTVALIVRKNGSVLLRRQPLESRWGGLWMFPFWGSKKDMLRHLKKENGNASALQRRMTLHHGFTKYRVRLDVYECNAAPVPDMAGPAVRRRSVLQYAPANIPVVPGAGLSGTQTRWIKILDLKKLAFPSPHQKIVRDLVDRG